LALVAGAARAADATSDLQGVWGWDFSDDMTCAANPHRITFDPVANILTFQWQKSVTNADGTTSIAEEFDIVSTTANRIEMIRHRDGFRGVLMLAADGKTYAFGAANPEADPSFEFPYVRCELAGS
jgi:hypothetical protein